ncbi:MAG: hypothetical protein P8X73_17545 [Ignavibacteriaceae bacterium]|jgi:hypothetical protein
MPDRELVRKILKSVIWDYNIDPYEYFLIASGKIEKPGLINKERALIRLIERLSWYELLSLFDTNFIKENLTAELISKLRSDQLKRKYELIRKVLYGETISLTGWDIENRKRIKSSLLSNRWYNTQ